MVEQRKPICRRPLTLIIGLAVCAGAALAFTYPSWLVRYHDWLMRAYQARDLAQLPVPRSDGLNELENGSDARAYEFHRDRLVELGAVARLEFRFRHLHRRTPEGSDLIRSLYQAAPAHIDWQSPVSEVLHPVELTVWCYQGDASAWEAFVADRDVVDYTERFMRVRERELR